MSLTGTASAFTVERAARAVVQEAPERRSWRH
jgi:hypothetical protein